MLVLTRGDLEGLTFNLSDGRTVTVWFKTKGRGVVCMIDAPLSVKVGRTGKLKTQGEEKWRTPNTNP